MDTDRGAKHFNRHQKFGKQINQEREMYGQKKLARRLFRTDFARTLVLAMEPIIYIQPFRYHGFQSPDPLSFKLVQVLTKFRYFTGFGFIYLIENVYTEVRLVMVVKVLVQGCRVWFLSETSAELPKITLVPIHPESKVVSMAYVLNTTVDTGNTVNHPLGITV